MIQFLFLDLDDTILDFHKAEGIALSKTLEHFGVTPTPERLARYSQLNRQFWERLERKELTRQQVLVGRFAAFFEELGKQADPEAVADLYAYNLGIGHYFIPGALEAVKSLSKKYRLFLSSNGTASVQHGRLKSADIGKYFEDIFISQDLGVDKPDKAFFERAFARIPDFRADRAMVVGDSLTSDIQGGINAGMLTCWVNPHGAARRPDITPDYEIPTSASLEALLETL